MTTQSLSTPSPPASVLSLLRRGRSLAAAIPLDLIVVMARLSIAGVFWRSGQTKLDGWGVSNAAVYLFETEYRVPLANPWLAAHLAAFAEHLFPALLVVGLFSRLSALALLGMTLVIEIFVYPDAWPTHGVWAVCLLAIVKWGPGRLSLDHFLARRLGLSAP